MWTRDSKVFWLGLAIALIGYLSMSDPPTMWSYADWLKFAAFVLAWGSGKLATSPLPGEWDRK